MSMLLALVPANNARAEGPLDLMMGNLPADEPAEAPAQELVEPEVPADDVLEPADDMAVTDGDVATHEGITMELIGAGAGSKTLVSAADGRLVEVNLDGTGSPSVLVMLSGLNPNQEYHLYRDHYDNHEVVVADASGDVSYFQDGSVVSVSWLQDVPSTMYIRDNTTGGDCGNDGHTWDNVDKKCTLAFPVNETISFQVPGGTLDCGGAANPVTGLGSGYGIRVNGHDDVTIQNCHVTNFGYGIDMRNTEGLEVLNNKSYDNASRQIYVRNAPGALVQGNETWGGTIGLYFELTDASADQARVIDNKAHDHNSYGFSVRDSRNIYFNENESWNNGSAGVLMTTGAHDNTVENHTSTNDPRGFYHVGDASGNTVKNSWVNGPGLYGAVINPATGLTTIDNVEFSNMNYGILAQSQLVGAVLKNNTIHSANNYGIRMRYTGGEITNNSISNVPSPEIAILIDGGADGAVLKKNTVDNCGYAIVVDGAPNTIVGGPVELTDRNTLTNLGNSGVQVANDSNGTRIENNKIDTTDGYGMYVAFNSDVVEVVNNDLLNIGNRGIYVRESHNADVTLNELDDIGHRGINVLSSNDVEVIDNTIDVTGQDGIFVQNSSGTVGAIVTDNTVSNSDRNGIEINGSDSADVAHNTVNGAYYWGIVFAGSPNGETWDNEVIDATRGLYLREGSNGHISTNDTFRTTAAYDGLYDSISLAIFDSSDAVVTDFTGTETTQMACSWGIWISGSAAATPANDNSISNSEFTGNCVGAGWGYYSDGNTLDDVTIVTENEDLNLTNPLYPSKAYYLFSDGASNNSNNTVKNSSATSPGSVISLASYTGTNNKFFNNTFTYGTQAIDNLVDPAYSITASLDPIQLYDEVTSVGNHWLKPNYLGYSQLCSDSNGDGVCEVPFVADAVSGSTDNFPFKDMGLFPINSSIDGATANPDGSIDVSLTSEQISARSYVITLPAGFTPLAGESSVRIETNDANNKAGVKVEANLNGGTKTLTIPRLSGKPGEKVCIKDYPGAEFFTAATSNACRDNNDGEGLVDLTAHTSPYVKNLGSHSVTVTWDADSVSVSGMLHSVVENITDFDGDGFTDDEDACWDVAGAFQGCPAQSDLTVELHIVDQTKTLCGNGKVSCKLPMEGVETMVMEMPADYTPKDADLYFEAGLALGTGVSLADGTSAVPHYEGGTLLAVSRWSADAGTWVYTSKEIVGGSADLKYMKQVKKNGDVRYLAATVVVTHGSLLETIFPQYFVWEDTVEYYPVAYVTDDNWEVDVCADAPDGYELTSILDENDQVVTTSECMHTVIPGDPRLFLYELTDLESPEPDMVFDLTAKHDGKVKKHKVQVPGYRKWTKAAAQAPKAKALKALKAEKAEAKAEVKAAKKSSKKQASVGGTTLTLASNHTLWGAAASQLGSGASNDEIKGLAKAIALANGIAVPEWGIKGWKNARSLSAGDTLDLSGLQARLAELNR
jgi:parallel beta-helix repeat protein